MSVWLIVTIIAALLLDWCQVSLAVNIGKRGRTKYRIIVGLYDLRHCRDKEHSLFVRNTTNRIGRDGSEYLDIDFEVRSTAHTLQKMTFVMHRCPLGVGGQCEYYDTWSFKGPCNILAAKGMIWTPMVEATTPRFRCPFMKGSYVSRNMTVDIGALGPVLDGVDAAKYTWPYEVKYFHGERLFMCYTFVGYHKRVRVRE